MGIFEKWAESLDYQYEVSPATCVRYKSPRASCQTCIEVCPVSAIAMDKGKPVIDAKDCTECGKCLTACPVQAVSGIFSAPDFQENKLLLQLENLPSAKELLIYHAKGVHILVYETEEARMQMQSVLDVVNRDLGRLGKEPMQLEEQSLAVDEESAYSRRELFKLWKNESKSILQQATPANWRFNQNDFELAKYHSDFQWYTIHIDILHCTLCKACGVLCSKKCFQFDQKEIRVTSQTCSNCRLCVDACPEKAIEIIEDIQLAKSKHYPVFQRKCSQCKNFFQTVKKHQDTCLGCSKRQIGYLRSSQV